MEIPLLKSFPRGFRLFLLKLVVFCILFIALTGILGPWIIGTKLLYGFGFFIYGNMGKMVLFSAISFIILTREKITKIKHLKYDKKNIGFIVLSFGLIPSFFPLATSLLKEPSAFSNIPLLVGTHLFAASLPVFLALGVFGVGFTGYFLQHFRKIILICMGLAIGFYFAIFQVWKLWTILSFMVMKSVYWLLSLHLSPVREVGPLTLFVVNFAVKIEQACSGIESIFLFSSLYILIALIDWKKLDHKKLIIAFFPALIGLFLVNILRVYLLILVGVYFSPALTLQLFHTYLGMVLFIIYFILFWLKSYRWMIRRYI